MSSHFLAKHKKSGLMQDSVEGPILSLGFPEQPKLSKGVSSKVQAFLTLTHLLKRASRQLTRSHAMFSHPSYVAFLLDFSLHRVSSFVCLLWHLSVRDLRDDQQLVFLLPFAHAATRLRLCAMFFMQDVIDIYSSDIADHLDMEKRQEINLHQYMSPDC